MNDETNTLYRALEIAYGDAKRQQKRYSDQVGQRPLSGWSREKHDNYHIKHAKEAEAASHYLFIRLMQINPY